MTPTEARLRREGWRLVIISIAAFLTGSVGALSVAKLLVMTYGRVP
jgi:hypothetical protein